MAAVPCHNGTRAIRPLLSLAPQMSYGSKSDEIRLIAGLGLRGRLWRRSCCNACLVQGESVGHARACMLRGRYVPYEVGVLGFIAV